jgi:RNA polymerase sigma-70 factor (ECF subfamily)
MRWFRDRARQGPPQTTDKVREDQRLVEMLQRGEDGAVEALVGRYGSWIHRVARRLLDDPRDAEEITQDVLLIVVRKIHTFKGEAAFSSWLYRIAVNAAYQRLRERGARREVSLEPFLPVFDDEGRTVGPVADWSPQLEDPALTAEVRTAIEGAIARLPEDYRVVILLRDVEGLPNEEVAGILGLKVAAVKSRLHQARLVLRHELAGLLSPAG